MISKLIDRMELDHLLDYGCGGDHSLTDTLSPDRSFKYQAYDATVPEYASEPVPAELVVCIDSLSQIKPFQVEGVLDSLEKLTEAVLFLVLDVDRMPIEWWLPRIMDRFSLQFVQVTDDNAIIIAYKSDYTIH